MQQRQRHESINDTRAPLMQEPDQASSHQFSHKAAENLLSGLSTSLMIEVTHIYNLHLFFSTDARLCSPIYPFGGCTREDAPRAM
jgi:hypothetical protein